MEKIKREFQLLDIKGNDTLVPFSKRMVIAIFLAIVLVLLGSKLPWQEYGEKAGLALGFFLAVIAVLIINPWSLLVSSMLMVVVGYWLEFWDWATFQSVSGNSIFVMMFAMMIVAAGAETTPIGRRVALIILKKLGKNPITMVVTIGLITAVLSGFISNTATLILMGSICNNLLITMNEVPGESKLGRVLFTVISMASFVGGAILISSSPAGNMYGIMLLEGATGGEFTITYYQWAIMGSVSFLVICIPMSLIYVWTNKLKNNDVKDSLPEKFYEERLKDLGGLSGSEIRWIITMMGMVIAMILGGHGTVIPLFCAIITLLPIVGTVPAKEVFNRIPLTILFVIFFLSVFGLLFSSTGLSKVFSIVIAPALSGLNPYLFSVVAAILMGVLVNVLVNGAIAVMALVIGVAAPICVSLGYNPSVILFPAILAGSMFFVLMLNVNMLVTKEYGWWDTKDSLVPGSLVLVLIALVYPAISMLVAPLIGMSIYL
ncbi:SLC13 family permease [Alkalibacter mobilis]|uniref:SLC13 family permease n=1 Tax=Alkalibacter mobilis TaxID=2787712 RepID=UPI00189DF7DD|nr:SLC13 family permease [Alkalibacter mobilis]MBF7097777.1 anion permease [Alkalibacter mobilis]